MSDLQEVYATIVMRWYRYIQLSGMYAISTVEIRESLVLAR